MRFSEIFLLPSEWFAVAEQTKWSGKLSFFVCTKTGLKLVVLENLFFHITQSL